MIPLYMIAILVLGVIVNPVDAFVQHQTGNSRATLFMHSTNSRNQGRRSTNILLQASSLKNNNNENNNDDNNSNKLTTRRKAIEVSAASALSALLVGTSSSSSYSYTVANAVDDDEGFIAKAATTKKTILMTGANSGIGFEAAIKLATQGHTLILPCRTMSKSISTVERLRTELPSSISDAGKIYSGECDLASLQSISNFVQNELPQILSDSGDSKLDTVCYNAGIARNTESKDCARTIDGFELIVGTNHFGHFYLNHLLLPNYISTTNGNIVVTASGVHDPESPGGAQGVPATLGDLDGLKRDGRYCEMIDGQAFNADKAYKDSKLCNVLFTRELHKRLNNNKNSGITVNCFNPGLIVSTGLFRDQNPIFTKIFDFVATDLFRVGETPEWGGGCLSYMATEIQSNGQYYTSPPGSSKYGTAAYGNQFTITEVSKEAQDNNKATEFWELSETLLAIN